MLCHSWSPFVKLLIIFMLVFVVVFFFASYIKSSYIKNDIWITFLLHNWIIRLCSKIKNKSCPDKELVSVPRELLMLIHLKVNKFNWFSSKSKKFNLEQGKEQSGWILDFFNCACLKKLSTNIRYSTCLNVWDA